MCYLEKRCYLPILSLSMGVKTYLGVFYLDKNQVYPLWFPKSNIKHYSFHLLNSYSTYQVSVSNSLPLPSGPAPRTPMMNPSYPIPLTLIPYPSTSQPLHCQLVRSSLGWANPFSRRSFGFGTHSDEPTPFQHFVRMLYGMISPLITYGVGRLLWNQQESF
jgi:hypothetical protein